MDNYYIVDDLMQIFGVSRLTILKKIKNKDIKAIKIANMRRWYIPKNQFNGDDINEYLKENIHANK